MMPRIKPATHTATKRTMMYSWEPPLEEMLEDPVVLAMMAVDGVAPGDVVSLLSEAKERLDGEPSTH
jgi:hypothetical protein